MLRFFKDFFIYGFASILGKIAAVFLMPIYTNILSKEEYGAMALITACKGVIDLFSNLNIHSGIARDYYECGIDRKRLVSTGIWSILGSSSVVLAIMFVTRTFWLNNVLGLGPECMLPFVVMLLSIPAGGSLSYFSIITRFEKKPIKYSIGTLIQLIVQISISIYGVVVLRLGIVSVFVGVLVGELFGIIYYAIICRSNLSLTFDKTYLLRALKFSIPTLPAILAGWVDNSMGQILIGRFISQEKLGVYSVALQFASIFILVSTALNNVWGPFLYENYSKPSFEASIRKLYIVIVIFLLTISVNLSLLSEEIVVFFSNNTYIDAAQYLTILCIPMSIYLLFPIANSGVNISRDTKYTGVAYVLGSLVNVCILLIFLPSRNVIVVPIALMCSRITTYCILYFVSKSKNFIRLPNAILVILVCGIIACYIIVRARVSLLTRLSILIIFDFIMLLLIGKRYNVKTLFLKNERN